MKFFPIEQAEGYENIAPLERMRVFDTATVKYTELGVQATAKCVKSVYDVLKNRYESLELGDIKANIADTIANQQKEIEQLPQSSVFQQAVENATNWITNGQKGEIVAIKRNGKWVEIASLDTGDINTAQSVWRWNNGGFGHSNNGYNGPFTVAMTADGHINASVITTGTLNANIIKAGRLESLNSKAYIDLTTGESAVSRLIGIESDVWVEIGQTSDDRGGEGMFLHKSESLVGQLSVAGGGGGTYPNALWLLSRGALVLQSNSTGYEDAPNRIVMEKDSNGKGVYRFSRGSTSQKMTDFFLANTSTMQLLQDMSSNLDGTSNYGKLAFDANGVLLERTFSADNMVRIWGVKANLSIRWGNGSATTVITLENGRVNIIVNSRSVAEFSDDEISFKTNLNMNGWNIQNSPSVA